MVIKYVIFWDCVPLNMPLSIPDKIQNFIGGQFCDPHSQKYMDDVNPATGEVICKIPDSGIEDVDMAVAAAGKAFPEWRKTSPEQRFIILNKIADLLQENLEFLALAETTDSGKPLWLSKKTDIPRASANFRFYATGIMHFASESHYSPGQSINYTLRQPLGVVGCISPWNLPLYLFTWKIAPALAAGNCVVAKPSEITPLTAYLLGHIAKQAGLPDGVLNIIHGTGQGCGEAIVKHPDIKAISFTGSTRAGKQIATHAAKELKKVSLELGGKNPNIIFADCNREKMMEATLHSSFSNQGQICLCGSRILIEESIYEDFKAEFIEKTRLLQVGDPLISQNQQGAVASKTHFEKIMNALETASKEGGKILCGGHAINPEGRCANGYFIEPTIIEGLEPNCKTNMVEIFGPVVTLQSFKNTEEALKLANACEYGLSASIWTNNISVANRMATEINAGIIWINCWMVRDLRTPFGGMKSSGIGREGGWEALNFFTESKNICIHNYDY